MSRQFIVHPVGSEYLVVDITGIGVKPARQRSVVRFPSWVKAEQYFIGLGAAKKELDDLWRSFEIIGKAILTIEAAEDNYRADAGPST